MDTTVHEVAEGISRISTAIAIPGWTGGFTFNQYLLVDDHPLFHTGPRRMSSLRTMFPATTQGGSDD